MKSVIGILSLIAGFLLFFGGLGPLTWIINRKMTAGHWICAGIGAVLLVVAFIYRDAIETFKDDSNLRNTEDNEP